MSISNGILKRHLNMQKSLIQYNKKPKTGFYDFADIDDDLISIHHYLKIIFKYGFSRMYDNLSLEIRNKRISRKNL